MKDRFWGLALLSLSFVACGTSNPEWYKVPVGTLVTSQTVIVAEDHSFTITAGATFNSPFWTKDCPLIGTPENFPFGESLGARRVRVSYPGLTEPLYGVLSLCPIQPGAGGPSSRSYQIEIPQSYVAATEGGRVSVVFEPYNLLNGRSAAAWILWLSRAPFPVR
jgi:hypothetical protein